MQVLLTEQRDAELERQLLQASTMLLDDEEPRVRIAAGECLGLLARLQGVAVWEHCRQAIYDSIQRDYVRRTSSAFIKEQMKAPGDCIRACASSGLPEGASGKEGQHAM